MNDLYRFLDPWTLLLPTEGGPVLAVAGSGGKTTLMRRVLHAYRAQGCRVLLTQTVPHVPPADVAHGRHDEPVPALRRRLVREGSLFVGGPLCPDGRWEGLSTDDLGSLRAELAPDVTLVEAHASTGTPLRDDPVRPVWPRPCHLAFLVAHLGAVGRPWGPEVIHGVTVPARDVGEEPRRVTADDVLHAYDSETGLLGRTPSAARPVPFLTGFGSFRDMDGMFRLVSALWRWPDVRVVCLAELEGDERRDEADARDLAAAGLPGGPFAGERVYALYPAALDEDGT